MPEEAPDLAIKLQQQSLVRRENTVGELGVSRYPQQGFWHKACPAVVTVRKSHLIDVAQPETQFRRRIEHLRYRNYEILELLVESRPPDVCARLQCHAVRIELNRPRAVRREEAIGLPVRLVDSATRRHRRLYERCGLQLCPLCSDATLHLARLAVGDLSADFLEVDLNCDEDEGAAGQGLAEIRGQVHEASRRC